MIVEGKNYKIISDQVGTPKMIVETLSGKVVQNFEFDEFGILMDNDEYDNKEKDSEAKVRIPFGFAGGLYDEDTKLVRFGARDYDSEVGRWMQKDPIGFYGGDSNLYRYSSDDPVNLIDPSGLSSITFSRSTGTVTIRDRNGKPIGTFPAGNSTTPSSNGPWPNGTFSYSHYTVHSESGPSGPYGSNGNFVFNVPGRTGMGVHSGRQGPNSSTLGCVRTTDEATKFLRDLQNSDPLTTITIGN